MSCERRPSARESITYDCHFDRWLCPHAYHPCRSVTVLFDAMDFDGTEQISMDEMVRRSLGLMCYMCVDTMWLCKTIVFLCCCRGLCVMAGVGVVPSDEALEAITLQAYRDYSKSSTQSISKTEFADWVVKFASRSHNGEVGSVKEVSLQTAMEQFGVVSTQGQQDFNEEDSNFHDGDSNHQGYKDDDAAADVAVASYDDASFAQDVEANHFEPGEQQDDTATHFTPVDQHSETAAQYEASEQHGETAEQYEATDQYDETAEQYEAADQHEHIPAQADPADQNYEIEAPRETAKHQDDSDDQYEATKLPGASAETFKSADQDDKPAEYDNEENYAREQQQEEESGSSDQGQVPDASKDEEYDEEYDTAVEDTGGSTESHDLPSESHDHDPLSGRDGHDPLSENDSNVDPEFVVTAETQDDSDYPASSSLEDIKGEDSDTAVDSDAAQPALSRPSSAISTEKNTEGNRDVLVEDSEDNTEADQAVPPAEDAPMVAEVTPPAIAQPIAIGVGVPESHSPEDTYEEEFAHEESAEGETQAAQLEEEDLSEYSIDEHQRENIETQANNSEPPVEDVGAEEAPPSTGDEESQEREETANSESAAKVGAEPRQLKPMDADDPAIAAVSNELQDGEESVAGAASKDGGEFEEDETINNGSTAEEQTPRNGEVDVNAFDTYDYEDAVFDASSGLPPPEPTDEGEIESPAPAEPDKPAEPASELTQHEPTS
jgi:hypothetical protein